jgi:ribosomal protein S18 acetylase RimI-like enzyme
VTTKARTELSVRDLRPEDLEEVARIDALHTGALKTDYWRGVFESFLEARDRGPRIGLAIHDGDRLAGYLFGETRAFEFGSEPCGWIHSVGVEPESLRQGAASILLEEACRRFREAGLSCIRTMVRRNDIPVLSFFRSRGFVGGPFVQLERTEP